MSNQNVTFPPIALFVYNRPDHTESVLDCVSNNKDAHKCDIYIFSDGPKKDSDKNNVQKVRDIINKFKSFGNVYIIHREYNLGLANSIVSGTTDLVDRYEKVVVVEDDLLLSEYFIQYMHESLLQYHNCQRVMQVSGFGFDVDIDTCNDAYFLPFTTSWGWGTWKRSWNYFDSDMSFLKILSKNKQLIRAFNLDNALDYYQMAVETKNGNLDSWAIKWYLSVFKSSGLTLYPKMTLVKNIGFDGTGTHCDIKDDIEHDPDNNFKVINYPNSIVEFDEKYKIYTYLSNRYKTKRPSYLNGILQKLKNIF